MQLSLAQWHCCRSRSALIITIRRPQGQIIAQQLQDQRGIFVRVLCHVVKLGNCIFESCASHLARLIWIGEHLILEDRKVQCQTQADGMCHSQIGLCDFLRFLISLPGIIRRCCFLVTCGELGNVTVVVGLHLLVENLRLTAACLADQVSIEQPKDRVANLLQLCLHLGTILPCILGLLGVSFACLLLFHAGNDTPCCSAAAHCVLVRHRQQVALLHGELIWGLADVMHVVCHLVVALCLLCQLGEIHALVTSAHCVQGARGCRREQGQLNFNTAL